MDAIANPATRALVAALNTELLFGQVLILKRGRGFELRHLSDREKETCHLRPIALFEARSLAQFTAAKVFRPLKPAPNLPSGWLLELENPDQLEEALNHLYPGALADWYHFKNGSARVTSYREFTGRQSGMYRITTFLTDEQAAAMARACCHQRFCLKRRLWTVGNLPTDAAGEKSVIPCLEPCAILLEFARQVARIEQEAKTSLELSESERGTLRVALEHAIEIPRAESKEAEMNDPGNPRRLKLMLEKIGTALKASAPDEEE